MSWEPRSSPTSSWHRPGRDAAATALLDLLLIHVHGHPERAWSVAALAACTGLSRAAFAKRFKDLVGDAPLTYLTRWRMTLAAQLLEATDLALAEVATRVGYPTEYSFAAAFKREWGTAPGGFRRAASRAS